MQERRKTWKIHPQPSERLRLEGSVAPLMHRAHTHTDARGMRVRSLPNPKSGSLSLRGGEAETNTNN